MSERPIARIAGDFVALVHLFHCASDEHRPDITALRTQLMSGLDQFTRQASSAGIPADEVEQARFALTAWADELIVTSGWSAAEEWSHSPLQSQLFQTHRGGNEFYERLHALRPDQSAAREIFFLCLAMGFRGQYMEQEAERQEVLRVQYETLRSARRARDVATTVPLSPAAYQLEIELDAQAGGSWLGLALRYAAFGLVLYGLLWGGLTLAARSIPLPPGA